MTESPSHQIRKVGSTLSDETHQSSIRQRFNDERVRRSDRWSARWY